MFAATLPGRGERAMTRLRWGIKTAQQHTTYDAMLAVWQEADRTSAFEHAWLFDHFAPIQGDLDGPCFEGWTLLAALAAQTARLRLGLMVAGNTYRHPAVHAHMAATVDVISTVVSISASVLAGTNTSTRAWGSRSMRPASASGASARPARSPGGCGRSSSPTSRAATTSSPGPLRAEADPGAVSPLRHWWQWRAAHPARCGALRRRLELHAHRRGGIPAQGARPARALRRGWPRSRTDRTVGADAGRLRQPRGDGRHASAARRGRRHPPRPDADLSLSRRDRRPAGRRGSGEGRLTSVILSRSASAAPKRRSASLNVPIATAPIARPREHPVTLIASPCSRQSARLAS